MLISASLRIVAFDSDHRGFAISLNGKVKALVIW